ncbi:flavodoxin family protein [Opitutaceae bacterium EW11]|nr:flavodoxin family protein [Opitutaceae bacterium EW11]
MANVLIVHAHPESNSFSSALARTAAETFVQAGHRVTVSDLYAMSFDPVSARTNYLTVANPEYFKPQAEEQYATEHGGFVPALETEMRKLEEADLLVFSFPLWWFGLPAILKGWVDRVFAYGRIYGRGRWYDQGLGRGKRALALLTTGSPATAYQRGGLHTDLETMLAPLHHGIFAFNGFSPLRPFVSWGAAHIGPEARADQLNALRERLATIWSEPTPVVPEVADYDPQTFADKRRRFLVTVRKPVLPDAPQFVPPKTDQQRLRDLRFAGTLVRALVGGTENGIWQAAFELRASDSAKATSLLSSLSMLSDCELTCTPLDLEREQALSPCWQS